MYDASQHHLTVAHQALRGCGKWEKLKEHESLVAPYSFLYLWLLKQGAILPCSEWDCVKQAYVEPVKSEMLWMPLFLKWRVPLLCHTRVFHLSSRREGSDSRMKVRNKNRSKKQHIGCACMGTPRETATSGHTGPTDAYRWRNRWKAQIWSQAGVWELYLVIGCWVIFPSMFTFSLPNRVFMLANDIFLHVSGKRKDVK